MAMKLDGALKLYIGLYVVCFLLTWLISVPMLIHVTPQSECLLFVTPRVQYGNPASCNIVGVIPIAVACCALVLIFLHIIQLRSLHAFLRKPGPHSSSYHNRPTHIFWRIVVFHGVVTLVVLIVAAILTAGYVQTCQNLYREVKSTVRSRIKADLWGGGESTNEHYDRFANDQSIDRYTNQHRDTYGRSSYEYGITCRNILTDPHIHSQLKESHAKNPYYQHYYGFWYGNDIVADVGGIHYNSYRDNLILELSMAGAWISFALWLIMLILMLKERHHIKAHLTDESMFGSEFGGRSQRSMSRISNQSFDKMSQSRYSNYSGSHVGSTGGRRSHHHHQQRTPPPKYQPPRQQQQNGFFGQADPPPLATSAPINHHPEQPQNPSNMLNFFTQPSRDEEPVDIDAALEMDNHPQQQPQQHMPTTVDAPDNLNYEPDQTNLDASFDLPVAVETSYMGGVNEPFPLGDEVSSGMGRQHIMQPPQYDDSMMSNGAIQQTPNRVTGRRGARMQQMHPDPYQHQMSVEAPSVTIDDYDTGEIVAEYTEQRYDRYEEESKIPPQQHQQPEFNRSLSGGYRTQLGNQSMI